MAETHTIDPAKVNISIGGISIHGFADGEFVSIERERDTFSKSVGADGEVTRVKTNDKSGTMELTLAQSSVSNDVLSGFAIADELNDDGIVPILVEDKKGTTTLFSAEGWVRKPPVVNYGNEIQNRPWMIDLARVDIFVGGNDN